MTKILSEQKQQWTPGNGDTIDPHVLVIIMPT
jgi:hypothetical protein